MRNRCIGAKGAAAVTSRDGERLIYAELKSGAAPARLVSPWISPRTANRDRQNTILLVLKKEDPRKILPEYPDIENATGEHLERLAILDKRSKSSERPQKPEIQVRRVIRNVRTQMRVAMRWNSATLISPSTARAREGNLQVQAI